MAILNNEFRLASRTTLLFSLPALALALTLSLGCTGARAEGVAPAAAAAEGKATTATSSPAPTPSPSAKPTLECERYKVYYIDMGTKFVAPPIPIEEHAQKVFCSKSSHIDRLLKALDLTKPIKKRADLGRGRIKIVPAKASDFDAALILDNGEVVRRMNTYQAPKKIVRGAVTALKEEAEKAP